jgi:hypothetical protein
MARPSVYIPGQSAPASGTYEQINVFGSPTGVRVTVAEGQPLPTAPVGHNWAIADVAEGDAKNLMQAPAGLFEVDKGL